MTRRDVNFATWLGMVKFMNDSKFECISRFFDFNHFKCCWQICKTPKIWIPTNISLLRVDWDKKRKSSTQAATNQRCLGVCLECWIYRVAVCWVWYVPWGSLAWIPTWLCCCYEKTLCAKKKYIYNVLIVSVNIVLLMNAQGGLSDSIQLWAQYDLVLNETKLKKKTRICFGPGWWRRLGDIIAKMSSPQNQIGRSHNLTPKVCELLLLLLL